MTKIVLAVAMSRKPWLRLLGFMSRDGATPLDLCVVLVSVVNVLTSVQLPLQDAGHVTLVSYSYGILNFAFIAASVSILMLIHAEFPGMSQWSRGQIVPNFTAYFLATALIGQGLIFMWARSIGLVQSTLASKKCCSTRSMSLRERHQPQLDLPLPEAVMGVLRGDHLNSFAYQCAGCLWCWSGSSRATMMKS